MQQFLLPHLPPAPQGDPLHPGRQPVRQDRVQEQGRAPHPSLQPRGE